MLFGNGCIEESLKINVNLDYSHVEWNKCYMIGFSRDGVKYNTDGVDENIKQEQQYLSLGMNPEASVHFNSFNASIDLSDQLADCYYDIGYFKSPAGNNLWWHKDYYHYLLKTHNIKKRKPGSIHRTIIQLDDWARGQVFEVEDQFAVYWKRGDCFTFPEDRGHGVGNFSLKDYVIMQVTWIKKSDVLE